MKASPNARRRRNQGFSILELLIAIIIIGILASILIPVIGKRSEQARSARAISDLEIMTESQNRVALDTGYYVRLFALNDVLQGDGIAFNNPRNTSDRYDGLTDYLVGQPYYSFVNNNGLFIDPDTNDYGTTTRANIIARLVSSESSYSGSIQWGGPYMNVVADQIPGPDGDNIQDDPWGSNYLLFTRLGLVVEPSGEIRDSITFTGVGTFDADVFDRPTILSLGPNGLPGNGLAGSPEGVFGRGDDYSRPFGK